MSADNQDQNKNIIKILYFINKLLNKWKILLPILLSVIAVLVIANKTALTADQEIEDSFIFNDTSDIIPELEKVTEFEVNDINATNK